jgi:hypothetical protein
LTVGFYLAVGVVPALAADLTKIERTLIKEPIYQTKTPKYGLLAFGVDAKIRVWVVLDGDVMYLDRNGSNSLIGLLTENGRSSHPKPSSPVGIRTKTHWLTPALQKPFNLRHFMKWAFLFLWA